MLRPSWALLAAASALLAGCASPVSLQGASTPGADAVAARADAMLQHPPGSDVKETGRHVEFDLYLVRMTNHTVFPGASMTMWAFSPTADPKDATVPGPTIRVTEGDNVTIHFHPLIGGYNHTIHFHGQDAPFSMDGVPFVSQKPVEAGQSFDYAFIAKPSGTYWYHCHVDEQHHTDMGMYGAFIVDPQDPNADPHYDKEFVLMVADMDRYHLEGGQPATGNAPQTADPVLLQQWAERQAIDLAQGNPTVADKVTGTPLRPTRGWYPVTYAPYDPTYNTWTLNGHSFPYTAPLVVHLGDVARIRFVNAGNSFSVMHLHGHHMLVTHKDGVLLDAPYWVDSLAIGPGERYDVYVKMDNPGIWDLHDHVGGHTQNDNVFPGGAMTMLCYDTMPGCGGDPMHHPMVRTSGQLIGWSPDVSL